MTKDELIFALQSDASPGSTPVVVRAGKVCITVSVVEPVRRYRLNDLCDGTGAVVQRVFLSRRPSEPQDGILTLTLS